MYEKLISIDSEGKATINEAELKKLLQVEGDRRSTEASRTARENADKELRDQIKAELEQEAKMSAEDKANKALEKEREAIKQERLAMNRELAESKFKGAGLAEEDYATLLEFVTHDKTKTIELVDKQIASISKIAEKQYQNKIKENMGQNSTPPASGTGTKPTQKAEIITSF